MVTEPTNLYPVYSQYDNIDVIYEGHDAETLVTRTGYGTAAKATDATTGDLILSVQPADNSPLLGDDPTVRFLGWYEYVGPEMTAEAADKDADPTHWLRVGRGEQDGAAAAGQDCFTFNVTQSGTDLTEPHIYKARFEYRVDYWACLGPNSDFRWGTYASVWHRYGQDFDNIAGPEAWDRTFVHWATLENTGNIDYAGVTSNPAEGLYSCQNGCTAFSEKIYAPQLVFAHHDDGDRNSNVIVTSDFPGLASDLTYEYGGYSVTGGGNENVLEAVIDPDDCNFIFWSFERDDHNDRSTFLSDKNRATFYRTFDKSHEWIGIAHLQARVTFHGAQSADKPDTTVFRRYENPVFRENDLTNTYQWYYDGNETITEYTSTDAKFAFDTDMSRQGYIFLGWLDMSDDDVSAVVGQITNGTIEGTDAYLAKSYRSVAAYLMTGEEVCTRPMDLYPVYIEFDVDTTTNIAEAGVDQDMYNVPADPSLVNEKIANSKGTVQVTFNDTPSETVTEGNTVMVDFNAAYEATVKVSVDNDQRIWTDTTKSDVYTFTSLSVYRDGELAQTVPASGFVADGEGKLTTSDAITIVAGCSYKFVANYSPVPVMVTYHYNYDGDGSTESFSTEVGQVLPTPTGTPSFSNFENAFVVGWTEDDANGAPADYKDSPAILTPGSDVVTGTMHLWPVYRTGSFVVNSNIDSLTDSDDYRGWTKTADGQSAELWARQSVEADGKHYTFQGWTTKGADGDIERTSTTWTLYGNDRFPDPKVTYTAIYAQVSEIRYHDTGGDVIYTASVKEGDERTFVNTVEVDVPRYDENGKPVIDQETGEQVTEKQEVSVPIDSQAFTAIAAAIDNKNAAEDAEFYEQFVTWQWVKSDGTTQRWGEGEDNFVNQSALQNMEDGCMDLYPVTMRLKATNPSNVAYTDLTTQLTLNEKTNELEKAMITLQSSYNQEWLKVHIDEVAYAPNSGTVTTAQKNIPVELYTPGSQIGSPVATDTTRAENDNTGATSLVPGDALFTFSGRITITKTATDEKAAGQVFSFTISDGTDSRTVGLQMPKEPTNGVYSNTVTVNVPFGGYTVTEDEGWAWRYDATVQHWELDSDGAADGNQPGWVEGGKVTVEFDSTVSANNPDGVTSAVQVSNALDEKLGDKWFDGSDFEHNVFGKDGE